eukprot:3174455-Pleurochrysis_carterae.AAC.3
MLRQGVSSGKSFYKTKTFSLGQTASRMLSKIATQQNRDLALVKKGKQGYCHGKYRLISCCSRRPNWQYLALERQASTPECQPGGVGKPSLLVLKAPQAVDRFGLERSGSTKELRKKFA